MTKLADVRVDPAQDALGEWQHFSGTAFVRLRRLGARPYQRALRKYQIERGAVQDPADVESRLDAEERLEADLIPLLAEHIVTDWTFDADAEPVVLSSTPERLETITASGGQTLQIADMGGKRYRKEGDEWQELLPWTPEASVAALTDKGMAVLLDFVRAWAKMLNVSRMTKAAEILGKSSKPPSGK